MLSVHGKFPAAQWVEHCSAKAVPVRMKILTRGTCRFFFVLFCFFFGRFVSFLILYLNFKQSAYNGDLLSQISWESGACQFSFSFHLFIFFFLFVYLLFSFDISLIVHVECRYNLIYIFFGVQFFEIHR